MTGARKSLLLWGACAIVLAVILQLVCGWHFVFIEQNQVFLYDMAYVRRTLSSPWGVAILCRDFLLQFFCVPCAGALIMSLLLTLAAFAAGSVVARLSGKVWTAAFGLLLIPALTVPFIKPSEHFEKLDCYARRGNWEAVVSNYAKTTPRILVNDLCCYDIALVNLGRLAEDGFKVEQADASVLLPEWGQDPVRGTLLSDLFFAVGHLSLSQRMAFETNEICDGEFNPRLVMRLVQTNIIYGQYAVAEKYISLLEKTLFYKGWAREHRRFLWNDDAVASDPLYGELRRCLPERSFFAYTGGIEEDMKAIVAANPGFKASREFLGMYYLLGMYYDRFKEFLETYYGKGEEMPKSFREAALIMSEMYPGLWRSLSIDYGEYKRYNDFCNKMENRISVEAYSDTFWYYLMSIHEQ